MNATPTAAGKSSLLAPIVLSGLLVAILLAAVVVLRQAGAEPPLPLRVIVDQNFVRITNPSSNSIPPLTVNVNTLDAWRFTTTGLTPGQSLTLRWQEFKDGDRALDPATTKPELILMRAKGYEVTIVNVGQLTQ